MKNTILGTICLLLLTLAAGCGRGKTVRIKGDFDHLKQGLFFAYSYSNEWDSYDSIIVKNGEFTFERPCSDTTLIYLQYPNLSQTLLIGTPGKTVKVYGDANNLKDIEIGGTKENELLNEFQQSLNGTSRRMKRQLAQKFIEEHPQSFASLAVLQHYFLNVERMDYPKVEKLFKLMLKATPKRPLLRTMYGEMVPVLHNVPGKRLPKFRAITLNDDTLTNETFKGKWLLINLYSNWALDFFDPMATANKVLKPYKGKIDILNICLDADTFDCLREIKRDTIKSYVVCDRKSWDSPLAKTFGIRTMPSNLLVNPKGIIVARDIPMADYDTKFKTYLAPKAKKDSIK